MSPVSSHGLILRYRRSFLSLTLHFKLSLPACLLVQYLQSSRFSRRFLVKERWFLWLLMTRLYNFIRSRLLLSCSFSCFKDKGSYQVYEMSDVSDPFSPSPSLLVNLSDHRSEIIEMLVLASYFFLTQEDKVPSLFRETRPGESSLGAAVMAAASSMVFQSLLWFDFAEAKWRESDCVFRCGR